jgi:hypothetical protein
MPEQVGRDHSGSPFGIRSIIQLVAMTVAIVLFIVGLQMAFGVYRLVQDTLLSPEHFAQIVETWAPPLREATREEREGRDDEHPGHHLSDEGLPDDRRPDEQLSAERSPDERRPENLAGSIAAGDSTDEGGQPSIASPSDQAGPDALEAPDTPEPAERSVNRIDGPNTDAVPPDGEDSLGTATTPENDPEATLSADATEHGEPVEESAVTEPVDRMAEAEAAWPDPREVRDPPAGPIDALEQFLINLNQKDLGRAGAGLLIVLFLFVLVKIPIALLTIAGNIFASLLKSSQTIQSITVRSGKSNSGSRRQRAADDSDRPLHVGDLTR